MVVFVETPETDLNYDLEELNRLIETANGQVVDVVVQKRATVDNVCAVGTGKLVEIADLVQETGVETVIFNCPLDAVQRRKIEDTLNCRVLDRIDLVLDIFALHAKTGEGKKQVELAQLRYGYATKPKNVEYTRQGGGIGTRGPGETKLETDKRVVRDKITRLRRELAELQKNRDVARQQRVKNNMFCIALVGYTNAGKSTLFNKLTNAGIYADDKLFATLDTTTRKLELADLGIEILLSDTVGFIKNLPHGLIEAFKSTLDEVTNADLILNVCDFSDKNVDNHIQVTESLLAEMKVTAPIIRVYNKIDADDGFFTQDFCEEFAFVSAKTGINIDLLVEKIKSYVLNRYKYATYKCSYEQYNQFVKLANNYAVKVVDSKFDEYCTIEILVDVRFVDVFSNQFELIKIR